MILHLVHDDKVIPRMISLFEQYNPHNNYFVCVSCKNKKSLRFLSDNPNIIMAYSKEEIREHSRSFSEERFERELKEYCERRMADWQQELLDCSHWEKEELD